MLTDTDRRRYTNGECWALAYAVHEHAGWPIVAIGEEDQDLSDGVSIGWVHVVNRRPDGSLVDAAGAHEIYDLLDHYGDYTNDGSAQEYEVPVERFDAMLHLRCKTIGTDTRGVAALLIASLT